MMMLIKIAMIIIIIILLTLLITTDANTKDAKEATLMRNLPHFALK